MATSLGLTTRAAPEARRRCVPELSPSLSGCRWRNGCCHCSFSPHEDQPGHLGTDAVAWLYAAHLKHKLMQPMQTCEAVRHPGGLAIQIDDTCLGRERDRETPRRGSENKRPS